MPCYEINLMSVDLKTADIATLKATLEALGLTFSESRGIITIQTPSGTITLYNGRATYTNEGCQQWINKIKQGYSVKTVERVAKKFKFNVNVKPENKITLRRY